jgi:inward rectifier potassium channel
VKKKSQPPLAHKPNNGSMKASAEAHAKKAQKDIKEAQKLNRRYISVSPQAGARQIISHRNVLKDSYHILMEASWWSVIAIMAFSFLAINLLFGFLYSLGGQHGLGNIHTNDFWENFFFSVQTFATIGYGYWYPKSTYANVIMTIEAFTQLMGTALITGLLFAKFSIPKAKVLFSHYVILTKVNGKSALRLRLANARGNQIVEAKITVTIMLNETSSEGEFMRRLYDIELDRSSTPLFALSWMVTHEINENSPLFGLNEEDFENKEVQIIVSMIGIDGSSSQTIHTRHFYGTNHIKCNARFADIFLNDEHGRRYIDFKNFHTVLSTEP